MKTKKAKHFEAHSANTKYGMGDHYGTGKRNPFGKMRSDSVGMKPVTKDKLFKPPKSLA